MEEHSKPIENLDRVLSLADAYRVMETFVANYLARGDTSVSDFLHCYAGLTGPARTTDPAAIHDFLAAANEVLGEPKASGASSTGGA
jgi:hypothetical protein